MKIIKDGDQYLVAKDNFVNLQESKDYFFIDEAEHKALITESNRACAIEVLEKFLEFCQEQYDLEPENMAFNYHLENYISRFKLKLEGEIV